MEYMEIESRSHKNQPKQRTCQISEKELRIQSSICSKAKKPPTHFLSRSPFFPDMMFQWMVLHTNGPLSNEEVLL